MAGPPAGQGVTHRPGASLPCGAIAWAPGAGGSRAACGNANAWARTGYAWACARTVLLKQLVALRSCHSFGRSFVTALLSLCSRGGSRFFWSRQALQGSLLWLQLALVLALPVRSRLLCYVALPF